MHEQRTQEWLSERAGKVTASCIYKVMARTKSGYGADRANYMAQLVAERLSGFPADTFTNAAMVWGIETEGQARAMYELVTGNTVCETGFHRHPAIPDSGASPDGLIDDAGLVEIKCPNTATHITTLLGGGIDRKYILQMHWQMICTGRDWCDFASFDPRLPQEMQLHVERVERDAALCGEIESEVQSFLAELNETVAKLSERYLQKEAA
jgi:putative phage-type endonuclease